jgi:hypothetical protein
MLTDSKGDPIPQDDPRIPRRSQIDAEKAKADQLLEIVRGIPGARRDVAEIAARVDALISLQVPLDGPVRDLFDFRVQESRGTNFVRIIEAHQAAKAEAERPRLLVPVGPGA